MKTLEDIKAEMGKGINSQFNACMYKEQCCATAESLADRDREAKNLKALLEKAMARIANYETSGMQLIGRMVLDDMEWDALRWRWLKNQPTYPTWKALAAAGSEQRDAAIDSMMDEAPNA